MVFKKLFPKKKSNSSITAQARLKTLAHKLDLKIKDYESKAKLSKLKAKKFLKAGNQQAAKTMLIRYKQYQQKIQQYNAMIMKTERHLNALEEAGMMKDVATTMEVSSKELKSVASTVNAQRAMEITEDAEESIEQISEAAELFAGDPEVDYMEDIDDELAALETELMLEDAGELPETPVSQEAESMSLLEEDDTESNLRSKEALQDEIAKLRKELDI